MKMNILTALFFLASSFSLAEAPQSKVANLKAYPKLQQLDQHSAIYGKWMRLWFRSSNTLINSSVLSMAVDVAREEKKLGSDHMFQILRSQKLDCIIESCLQIVLDDQKKELFFLSAQQFQSLEKLRVAELKFLLKSDPNSVELKLYVQNELSKAKHDATRIQQLTEKLKEISEPTTGRKILNFTLMTLGGLFAGLLLLGAGIALIAALGLATTLSGGLIGVMFSSLIAMSAFVPYSLYKGGNKDFLIQEFAQSKEFSARHIEILEEIQLIDGQDESLSLGIMP